MQLSQFCQHYVLILEFSFIKSPKFKPPVINHQHLFQPVDLPLSDMELAMVNLERGKRAIELETETPIAKVKHLVHKTDEEEDVDLNDIEYDD